MFTHSFSCMGKNPNDNKNSSFLILFVLGFYMLQKEGSIMTEEILRTGGCLCGKSRYQTRGDSPRAIMCHCRYCQTYTGSAFGTQVWFPEDKVTLISGELSKYDNNTETGKVVT